MSRDIKFKFIVERDGIKHLSRSYLLDEDGLPPHDEILEDMEGVCTCNLNESSNHCDGSCMEWENAIVVGQVQSTGLKDKKKDLTKVYEGDIIGGNGLVIGNKYEDADLLKDETNLLIQGFRTKDWLATYQKAMDRGCTNAE